MYVSWSPSAIHLHYCFKVPDASSRLPDAANSRSSGSQEAVENFSFSALLPECMIWASEELYDSPGAGKAVSKAKVAL